MSRVVRLLVVTLAFAVLLVTIVRAAGDPAISKAVKAGDLATVRKLIASRADVNVASGDGSTPMLWAVHNSDFEMVKALVAAGAKVDVANNYGVTPLLDASRTGDAAMMELLLKAGADPKRTHPEGETPLMAASRSGSVPAVRLLLDRGVDVNATDMFQQETALMWAAAEGHAEVVDALLKAGADPNRKARVTIAHRTQECRPSHRRIHGSDVGSPQWSRSNGATPGPGRSGYDPQERRWRFGNDDRHLQRPFRYRRDPCGTWI